MPIEIRQLTINSSVSDNNASDAEQEQKAERGKAAAENGGKLDDCADIGDIKADILAECKRLIRQSLEQARQR